MLMLPLPLMPPAAVKVNTLVDDQLRSAATLILPVPAPDVPELVVVMLMVLRRFALTDFSGAANEPKSHPCTAGENEEEKHQQHDVDRLWQRLELFFLLRLSCQFRWDILDEFVSLLFLL